MPRPCRSRWCRSAAMRGETDVGGVVRADLDRSGQFRSPDPASLPERPTQGSEVAYPTWRMLKQDYLLVGRVRRRRRRRLPRRVRTVRRGQAGAPARLRPDRARPAPCATWPTRSATRSTRRSSACRGAFWTRIAYVTASGLGRSTRYALMVADSDGYNPQTVVNSHRAAAVAVVESRTAASWPTSASRAATPAIYIQDIATGSREQGGQLPRHQRRARRSRPTAAAWP